MTGRIFPIRSTLAVAAVACYFLSSSPHSSFNSKNLSSPWHRQLRSTPSVDFADPKSVVDKDIDPSGEGIIDEEVRRNCQFLIVLGAEGALHQDIEKVISELASLQGAIYVHPRSGESEWISSTARLRGVPQKDLFNQYVYNYPEIYGHPSLDDLAANPRVVPKVMEDLCPNDGQRRIYYGDKAFPAGTKVGRNPAWDNMSAKEIAQDVMDSRRPIGLYEMMRLFSPYAEIKLIALHRPYLSTVARHSTKDGGPVAHSRVIAGHMMVLSQFLNVNTVDRYNGSRLWAVLCADQLLSTSYNSVEEIIAGRQSVLQNLAKFLGWPVGDCEHCFDNWHEKRKDPVINLGLESLEAISQDIWDLHGFWPPRDEAMSLGVEQCAIEPTFPGLPDLSGQMPSSE